MKRIRQLSKLNELFDKGHYVDTNYDVNLGHAIFLLTSNFGGEEEIKKSLVLECFLG